MEALIQKRYIFNCSFIPEDLHFKFEECLEHMEQITMREFVLETEIDDIEILRNMILYPNDFDFFKFDNWLIYEHSAIHYVYE